MNKIKAELNKISKLLNSEEYFTENGEEYSVDVYNMARWRQLYPDLDKYITNLDGTVKWLNKKTNDIYKRKSITKKEMKQILDYVKHDLTYAKEAYKVIKQEYGNMK